MWQGCDTNLVSLMRDAVLSMLPGMSGGLSVIKKGCMREWRMSEVAKGDIAVSGLKRW